ncbi:hypothetical protein BGLA2_70014 [Burkholderia gladioli]|nr:hypothetical protein BGLA2_70014 [Burkholderia gladioli]
MGRRSGLLAGRTQLRSLASTSCGVGKASVDRRRFRPGLERKRRAGLHSRDAMISITSLHRTIVP